MNLDSVFTQFLREKRYVTGCTEKTLTNFQESYKVLKRVLGELPEVENWSSRTMKEFVTLAREKGMKPQTVNHHLSHLNSLMGWLLENEYVAENCRIKQLKVERRILRIFTDAQMLAIINFKPRRQVDRRVHTMLCVLADTGIRINELLTLRKVDIDFDNQLLKVRGKGRKERIVPMSLELRKIIWKYAQRHSFELLFCNSYGGPMIYNNVRRDFVNFMRKLGIEGYDGSFHAFRRFFATNFIKQGGNPLVLQRLLGHTSLQMTNRYVMLVNADLAQLPSRVSILSRKR
jgi:integrase/recombinase XerD